MVMCPRPTGRRTGRPTVSWRDDDVGSGTEVGVSWWRRAHGERKNESESDEAPGSSPHGPDDETDTDDRERGGEVVLRAGWTAPALWNNASAPTPMSIAASVKLPRFDGGFEGVGAWVRDENGEPSRRQRPVLQKGADGNARDERSRRLTLVERTRHGRGGLRLGARGPPRTGLNRGSRREASRDRGVSRPRRT